MGFCIPINPEERAQYLDEVKASREEEPVAATSLSIHIGTDFLLNSVIAATRKARPELSFEESWNLLRHSRPELFSTTANGYEKTELVQAQSKPAGKQKDCKVIAESVQRDHPGWTFEQSWQFAEAAGLFAVKE